MDIVLFCWENCPPYPSVLHPSMDSTNLVSRVVEKKKKYFVADVYYEVRLTMVVSVLNM